MTPKEMMESPLNKKLDRKWVEVSAEIESLREQLAAKGCADFAAGSAVSLRLAATEALCQKYREALEYFFNSKVHTMSSLDVMFYKTKDALANPSPTAALNQAIAAELRRMAAVFEKQGWWLGVDGLTHRAAELEGEVK
jgi:hypothetical protein